MPTDLSDRKTRYTIVAGIVIFFVLFASRIEFLILAIIFG